jgi:hypothetical protein
MKRLLLPVCCAVVAASAAELKHPSEVAREWDRTVEEAKQTVVTSTLSDQTSNTPKLTEAPPAFFGFGPSSVRPPTQPGPRYDAPGRQRKLTQDRPPGAMPWEYRGETYWLVPLSPSGAP